MEYIHLYPLLQHYNDILQQDIEQCLNDHFQKPRVMERIHQHSLLQHYNDILQQDI